MITHKPPRQNIPVSCAFRVIDVCSLQTSGSGRTRIVMSVTTLRIAKVKFIVPISIHLPVISSVYIAFGGMHDNMVVSTNAVA